MTDLAISRALLEVLSDPKVAWRNESAQTLIDAVAKRAGEIDGTVLSDAQGSFNLVDEYQYCRAQMAAVWNFLSPNTSNDMDWADEVIIAIQNRKE